MQAADVEAGLRGADAEGVPGLRRRPTAPTSRCSARWLEEHTPNVHPVGRNGMHKYNNQDHSMFTAMLTVENILGRLPRHLGGQRRGGVPRGLWRHQGHGPRRTDPPQPAQSLEPVIAPAPPSGRRLVGFDGLRLLAAVSIVAHHAAFMSGATFDSARRALLRRVPTSASRCSSCSAGSSSTGPSSPARSPGAAPTPASTSGDATRIYPAYWVVLATTLIIGGTTVGDVQGLAPHRHAHAGLRP